MNFPSVQSLWISLKQVVFRFPLQVLCAIVAAVSWCLLVKPIGEAGSMEEQLGRIITECNLALTLLLAGDLYAEVTQLNTMKKWGLRILALLICTGLYFLLRPAFYVADVYRIGLLGFAFHLLVAFAPFIGRGNLNGFWQYNKSLFLRFLTSALYAGVLYAGLSVALVAINGLFNAEIGWKIYMQLFAVVTAGFMTIFFLAGIPLDFRMLDKEEDYPKGLKIFTQYVLIPLMTIYLMILLIYEVKIVLEWELPKGLVSMLILGYAVFGILSLLLIYPVKDRQGNGWIKLFSKFFYVMMIPLVVLLLLAVWKRTGNYGITESRYILIVLAIWLTLITAYFLFSKKQNIRIIPVSLCLLSLLAVYGPQSASSVSRYSQLTRLEKLLKPGDKKSVQERTEVIDYLVERHGLRSLQSFTSVNLSDLEERLEQKSGKKSYMLKESRRDTAYALLKVKRGNSSYRDNITLEPEGGEAVAIKGYDYVIAIDGYATSTESKINGKSIIVKRVNDNPGLMMVKIGNESEIELDIDRLVKNAVTEFKKGKLKESDGYNQYYLPKNFLSIHQVIKGYELKLVLSNLKTITDTDDAAKLKSWLSYNGFLLIIVK